jgi:outer membrane murein-binding lipoprotein Lpp
MIFFYFQSLIDQLTEDVKQVRPSVEKTRPNTAKNPDVDRLEEDVNRMAKRWGNCCMQVGIAPEIVTYVV